MSALSTTRYVLECDGCGKKYGAPDGFASAIEARGSAYGDGWRFPNQIGKSGQTISSTSDACPDCVPNWTPQPRAHRIRHVSRAELEAE